MNEELIAHCGMNCAICSGYLAYRHDVKSKGITFFKSIQNHFGTMEFESSPSPPVMWQGSPRQDDTLWLNVGYECSSAQVEVLALQYPESRKDYYVFAI